jgi:hypothetical protein
MCTGSRRVILHGATLRLLNSLFFTPILRMVYGIRNSKVGSWNRSCINTVHRSLHTPLTNNPTRHAQVVRQQYKGHISEANVHFVSMNNRTQVTRSAVRRLLIRRMTKLVYPCAGDSISQADCFAMGGRVTRYFGSYNFNQQLHTVLIWLTIIFYFYVFYLYVCMYAPCIVYIVFIATNNAQYIYILL